MPWWVPGTWILWFLAGLFFLEILDLFASLF